MTDKPRDIGYDMDKADYLAAVDWPRHEPGADVHPCTHQPYHVVKVDHPTDPDAGTVRVRLWCPSEPAHASRDRHGNAPR